MRIRDLAAGADLPDRLEGTYYGTAWSADERYLFYTRPDHAMRPYQVWRHEVGATQADDVLIYEEPDERYNVDLELCRSGAYVIITNEANTSTDVLVLAAAEPLAEPQLVAERQPEVEYRLDHWGDRFVILTNLDAPDFKVVTAPCDSPAPAEWVDLVPHQAGRRITQVEPFVGHLVLHEWADALERIRILRGDGTERTLAFDDPVHSVAIGANPEYHTPTVRFTYESLVTPPVGLRRGRHDGRSPAAQAGPGPRRVRPRRLRVGPRVGDGARRDVGARRRRLAAGHSPGRHGAVVALRLRRLRVLPGTVVLDRALVVPRPGRGVGARPPPRRRRARPVAGTSTASCSTSGTPSPTSSPAPSTWSSEGYGAPDRVTARGGSAGGLLVGACVTLRPELYAGVIAAVPFVDVVTTMRDPSIPLTVTEWDEWGDPRAEPYASYMLGYSPYDNVAAGGSYPALYVTAGLNDPRVMYHEPAKWVAKLRATATTRGPLLLRTELGAGHAGPSGRYEIWRDEARMLTFLLVTSGITS